LEILAIEWQDKLLFEDDNAEESLCMR